MRFARHSVKTWLLAAVAATALSAGCSGAPPNVIVITLDTTRADRLAPYGFMDAPMPALERLANEGAVFLQASSVAPLTLPAHTSLFTGLLPPHHGVRDNADPPLAQGTPTLAETLRARGYRTGAFVASVVLDGDRGLARGFEAYHGVTASTGGGATGRQRRADAVIDDALGWLDTIGGSRFFLWAHLYDAHRPYEAPEPYRSRYAHDPYVGEIAFMDGEIGRLLRELEGRRLLDRTVIVVAGDHGESLGDHGESRSRRVRLRERVARPAHHSRARPRSGAGSPGRAPDRCDADDSGSCGRRGHARRRREPDGTHARRGRRGGSRRLCRVALSGTIRLERAARGTRRALQADRCAAVRAVRSGPRSVRAAQHHRRTARARRDDAPAVRRVGRAGRSGTRRIGAPDGWRQPRRRRAIGCAGVRRIARRSAGAGGVRPADP